MLDQLEFDPHVGPVVLVLDTVLKIKIEVVGNVRGESEFLGFDKRVGNSA